MIRLIFVLVAAIALFTPLAQAAPPHSPLPKASQRARPGSPPPAPSPNAPPASFDLGVWTVHASSIDANFKSGDFSTPAKLVMTRVGGDVSADRANGNYKRQ